MQVELVGNLCRRRSSYSYCTIARETMDDANFVKVTAMSGMRSTGRPRVQENNLGNKNFRSGRWGVKKTEGHWGGRKTGQRRS